MTRTPDSSIPAGLPSAAALPADRAPVHHARADRAPAGLARAGLITALVGSLALLAGSAWWLLAPAQSPFGAGNPSGMGVPMLAGVVGREASQWGTLVLAGAAGLLSLTGLARLAGRRHPLRPAVVLAVLAAALVWLTSASGLSMVGYLLAVSVPVLGAAVIVALLRRRPRLLWAVVPALLLVAAGVVVAGGLDVLGDLAGKIGATMAPLVDGPILLGVGGLLVQTGWAVTWAGQAAADVARHTDAGAQPSRATGWLLRHRRLVTLLAAGALLPYLLVRLTWLTPLVLLTPGELAPEDRVWGLTLGAAAALGIVLTLGLILPWGERFPGWVPAVGGRSVPVPVALVPGGLVATVATLSAVPMFVQVWQGAGLATAVMVSLLIPAWFWGPMLGLALWAYAVHRMRQPGAATRQPRPGKTYPSS